MNRIWRCAVPALLATILLAGAATTARAAAEIHKLNLVLSFIPTQVDGGNFNDLINSFNKQLSRPPNSLQGLDQISSGWLYEAELRYFARPNFAVCAGVGQLRAGSDREYLPSLSSDVTLKAEIISAPIHVGGDFYFTPYNQGDFQARAFLGGGLLSLTSTHSRLQVIALSTDSLTNAQIGGGSFKLIQAEDSPGYYVDLGVHMFFAMRYSVMLGGTYRSAVVRRTATYFTGADGVEHFLGFAPMSVDAGGIGAKASLAIGF